MRETQVARATPVREQTYRVNTGRGQLSVERAIDALTADLNRLLGDIAIRLDRVEKRLDMIDKQ